MKQKQRQTLISQGHEGNNAAVSPHCRDPSVNLSPTYKFIEGSTWVQTKHLISRFLLFVDSIAKSEIPYIFESLL